MTPHDIEIVRNHHFHDSSQAIITLSKGKGDIGEQLSRFCDELKLLVPHITVKKDSDISFKEPVMVVGRHKNIAYYAIPTGKILPLFIDALDNTGANEKGQTDDLEKALKHIDLPATLKLYVADLCPHCPQAIQQIQNLAAATPLMRLQIINAELFTEMAQIDQIRSVPTLVLDSQFRWTGQINPREIIKICTNRDPSQLSADSLRQLVEEGDAPRLATMMAQSDQIFPAFIELLTHQRWSVRLGAMVTAEYLADEVPELALALCRLLWDRFADFAPQIQGDVTHLFGLVDSDATRGHLKSIATGAYEGEVKEAAADVLAEMET